MPSADNGSEYEDLGKRPHKIIKRSLTVFGDSHGDAQRNCQEHLMPLSTLPLSSGLPVESLKTSDT